MVNKGGEGPEAPWGIPFPKTEPEDDAAPGRQAAASPSASSRGSRRDTTCETPVLPIVTP
jgi:hypothetical protein